VRQHRDEVACLPAESGWSVLASGAPLFPTRLPAGAGGQIKARHAGRVTGWRQERLRPILRPAPRCRRIGRVPGLGGFRRVAARPPGRRPMEGEKTFAPDGRELPFPSLPFPSSLHSTIFHCTCTLLRLSPAIRNPRLQVLSGTAVCRPASGTDSNLHSGQEKKKRNEKFKSIVDWNLFSLPSFLPRISIAKKKQKKRKRTCETSVRNRLSFA
jgi:hypothetical protein